MKWNRSRNATMSHVGLVAAESALIVLIGAGLLYAASNEQLEKQLSAKLDNAADDGPDEVETILREVEEGERDKVQIDGLTVNQILGYKDTSCGFQDLANPRRIIKHGLHLTNRGVSQFVNFHIDQRKKSCEANFYKILEQAVEDIRPDDKKIVENLSERRLLSLDYSVKGFPICFGIIEKLSRVMWFVEWMTVEFVEQERKLIEYWSDLFETCKVYTKEQCKSRLGQLVGNIKAYSKLALSSNSGGPLELFMSTQCQIMRQLMSQYEYSK